MAVAWAKEVAVRGGAKKAEAKGMVGGAVASPGAPVAGAGFAAEAVERTRATAGMIRAPAAAMAKGAAVATATRAAVRKG